MNNKRLQKIKEKDPIIGTYSISSLISASKIVDETYSEHALTHVPVGDTSDYLKKLINWIKVNKGCALGAIVGSYGYGKSSTAIHFWKECEKENILSLPPTSWKNLDELLTGINAWVSYRLNERAPLLKNKLNEISVKYQKKTLEEISLLRNIPLEQIENMKQDGELILGYKPEDIINYLSEITDLILSAGYKGLCIFLDELQITLSGYPTRDKFMTDIFVLGNELLNREGKYGMIFCMPTITESLISDIRKDIIHRFQKCNLFIRTDSFVDRKFPLELWEKYAILYEFKDIIYNILPKSTLDAIGQISSRNDLGAGPRSVIDAFKQAVVHYEIKKRSYSQVDLINDYLVKKIAFVQGGKFIKIIREAIDIPYIAEDEKRKSTIKVLSAYPKGCPDEILKLYNLTDTMDDLTNRYYGDIIIKSIEGYTLRKLLLDKPIAEPHFIRLTKDFINRYTEDNSHAIAAKGSFIKFIIDDIFMKKNISQIVGWKTKEERIIDEHTIIRKLEGTFNPEFPYRKLNLIISSSKIFPTIKENDDLTIIFYLNWNCDKNYNGEIKFDDNKKNIIMINLNLLHRLEENPNIAYISKFFPTDKMSPMFMLSLLNYLEEKKEMIPTHEIEGEMKVFQDRLINISRQVLLNNYLRESSKVPFNFVGNKLIEEIFSYMCKQLYPEYITFITSSHWKNNLNKYLHAIKDDRINLKIARGKEIFEGSKEEIANIFGMTRILELNTVAGTLKKFIKIEEINGRRKISFLRHPLEEKILEWIRNSDEKIIKKGIKVSCIFYKDIFVESKRMGYLDEELHAALEILKTRKYIDYDQKSKRIYEYPASIEEHKILLNNKLNDLRDNILELKKEIINFNEEIYTRDISKINGKFIKIENIEDCESMREEIHLQFKKMNGYISKYEGNIEHDLLHILDKLKLIKLEGPPKNLIQDIEGQVSWVVNLNELRQMILSKYNKVFSNMRELSILVSGLLDAKNNQDFGVSSFIYLYKESVNIKKFYETYKGELNAAKSYFEKFEEWLQLLRNTNKIFSDAQRCKEQYNILLFLEKLNEIFKNMKENFDKRKLEGLADIEIFSGEINKIGEDINKWESEQRGSFLNKKENFQKKLQQINISEYNLRTNFDTYDPSGSFDKLHDEVFEKVVKVINELENKINYSEEEILYSINILDEKLDDYKIKISKLKKDFKQLKKDFNREILKNANQHESFCQKFKELATSYNIVRADLRGIINPKPINKEEEDIINLLKDSNTLDLKEVIMKISEKKKKIFDLSSILELLGNLFKKNQIIVKIILRK